MTTTATASKRTGGGRGARDRILAAATELFYFDGINATGVDRVASKADVSKRTLYKHFPSKAVLVEQYLAHLRAALPDPREAEAEGPRARLLSLFPVPEQGVGRMRGCPFHNAAVEAAASMPGVEDFVRLHKLAFLDAVTDLCREFGADDPVLLGKQIALLYEGAAALSTSLDDSAPWACARTTAAALLDGSRSA
ncbi:TetR/AcrR family transcriptional regulator [Antrihabitans stalactiti]|uniref:TetR/AcrR family transcriptional regulator n=1 Tax=Antrihabitans stalactiti TaxID=2584121 RepID=A0A848KCQ4_9NOCA|nr:TetR/AcrR family transcriptional regulator [Antrihabitans stalactiti]NMN93920.1 TetR/AcrR family transcriptional regulator [Antrihabitans stalactiti]